MPKSQKVQDDGTRSRQAVYRKRGKAPYLTSHAGTFQGCHIWSPRCDLATITLSTDWSERAHTPSRLRAQLSAAASMTSYYATTLLQLAEHVQLHRPYSPCLGPLEPTEGSDICCMPAKPSMGARKKKKCRSSCEGLHDLAWK